MTLCLTLAKAGVTWMDDKGVINMIVISDSNAVHEATHAFQHLTGDLQYLTSEQQNILQYPFNTKYHDGYDELDAYAHQFAFDPSSIPNEFLTSGKVMLTVENLWSIERFNKLTKKVEILYPKIKSGIVVNGKTKLNK